VRVLKWILERVEGRGGAQETPIGHVPARGALTLEGMNISASTVEDLMRVDPEDWEQELIDIKEFFQKFGDRLPSELNVEHENLSRRLAPREVAR
jgi:phosphoenolpyruvate carboxykinase (GTP)